MPIMLTFAGSVAGGGMPAEYIITEDEVYLITEDEQFLITEGDAAQLPDVEDI
jgi:hypothetical protein